MMRREEDYIGRRAMEMKVQGRKRGRSKRRCLNSVEDDIKEKELLAEEVYDRATWRRIQFTSTRHKSGNKKKKKKHGSRYALTV